MAKTKKVKVKKIRQLRVPRQAVPRHPPITNVSIHFASGGSYHVPNAQTQQTVPLVNNIFNPTPHHNLEHHQQVPHNNSSTQTDVPTRVTRGSQSNPVFILPNELNPNVSVRPRREIAAGGGTTLPNPDAVPLDIIPPPILPRTPIIHRQQETPSPSTPEIRVVPRRTDTPTPHARAAGGGAGSRGGLTTLNQQQIHDLARSYHISTENRSMATLRNMISQQRKKG